MMQLNTPAGRLSVEITADGEIQITADKGVAGTVQVVFEKETHTFDISTLAKTHVLALNQQLSGPVAPDETGFEARWWNK